MRLKNLDLSKYKLAYFYGDSLGNPTLSQDKVMVLADADKLGELSDDPLRIALIPKNEKLSDCNGDDWDDTPADCNASGFYVYPKGTIFLEGNLGKELKIKGNFS